MNWRSIQNTGGSEDGVGYWWIFDEFYALHANENEITVEIYDVLFTSLITVFGTLERLLSYGSKIFMYELSVRLCKIIGTKRCYRTMRSAEEWYDREVQR